MVSVIFLILINHFNNIIYICSVELICTLVKLYHNIHLYHCLQLTGTRDQHWNRLTLWNLKKVLRDTQPRPMKIPEDFRRRASSKQYSNA